ncbi:hypothetical protein AGMMS49975_07520 [Clostridia bacterium]|nr:hypothetical protein AGMMS49975_07520 [Clostridia bacterium]
MDFYTGLLSAFDVGDQFVVNISFAFILYFILLVVMRFMLFVNIRSKLFSFRHNAKEIKTKTDFTYPPKGFFTSVTKSYINACRKNPSPNTAEIVEKHLLSLRFMTFLQDSATGVLVSSEKSILFIGAGLMLFSGNYQFFAGITIILLVLQKIPLLFFDISQIRGLLKSEFAEYLDRELGQFFVSDIKGVMSSLNAAIKTQNDTLTKALSYIEKNQTLLTESLSRYEGALKSITTELGGALGTMVSYHTENTFSALQGELSESMLGVIKSNNELLDKLDKGKL